MLCVGRVRCQLVVAVIGGCRGSDVANRARCGGARGVVCCVVNVVDAVRWWGVGSGRSCVVIVVVTVGRTEVAFTGGTSTLL